MFYLESTAQLHHLYKSKKSCMAKQIIVEIIRLLFIILFVYAATSKLIDYNTFLSQLSQSPLLVLIERPVALTIPIAELVIAVLLCFQTSFLFALYASYTMMVLFTAYIVAITRFSEYVPCSCGGILSRMNWNQHLLFNCAFVAAGAFGIIICKTLPDKAKKAFKIFS